MTSQPLEEGVGIATPTTHIREVAQLASWNSIIPVMVNDRYINHILQSSSARPDFVHQKQSWLRGIK